MGPGASGNAARANRESARPRGHRVERAGRPKTRTARSSVSGPPHRTGGRRPALARCLQPQPASHRTAHAMPPGWDPARGEPHEPPRNRGLADVCCRPIPIGRARSRSSSYFFFFAAFFFVPFFFPPFFLAMDPSPPRFDGLVAADPSRGLRLDAHHDHAVRGRNRLSRNSRVRRDASHKPISTMRATTRTKIAEEAL